MKTGTRYLQWTPAAASVLLALLLAAFAAELLCGSFPVSVSDLFSAVLHPQETDEAVKAVISGIRLPRAVMALAAGAGLAAAGAAFQAMFANPLATPDTLGVATGASFGAVLAILFGGSLFEIQISALLFGLIAVGLVWQVSRVRGANPVFMMILAGIVIGALFSALVSLVKFAADPQDVLPSVTFWLMGSLSGIKWDTLIRGLPLLLLSAAGLFLYRWKLNLLSLPEDEAKSLGVPVMRTRAAVVFLSTLITASVVSMCGLIGWVGLLIPHIARMLFGSNQRAVLPASLFLGGAFLLIADVLARTLTSAEIPVAVLTAVIGAPVFILLLRRSGGFGV